MLSIRTDGGKNKNWCTEKENKIALKEHYYIIEDKETLRYVRSFYSKSLNCYWNSCWNPIIYVFENRIL